MSSVLRSRRSTLGVLALAAFPVVALAQSAIPSRLTDKELWQLNAEFSEPGADAARTADPQRAGCG